MVLSPNTGICRGRTHIGMHLTAKYIYRQLLMTHLHATYSAGHNTASISTASIGTASYTNQVDHMQPKTMQNPYITENQKI